MRGERNWNNLKPKFKHMPYWEWEDYQLGLFGDKIEEDKRELCVELLKDLPRLEKYMTMAVKKCPKRWRQVIETRMNHQAWLGAMAGCLAFQCNDATTRNAWGFLNQEEQKLANEIADKVRKKYE